MTETTQVSTPPSAPSAPAEPGAALTTAPAASPSAPTGSRPTRISWVRRLGLDRFSAIYAWVAMIVGFAIAAPSTFLTPITGETILADHSLTALIALAALVPLVAGIIDLSVASVAGFSYVAVIWLSANTTWHPAMWCLAALAGCAMFGVVSAFFITRLQVNALVVTIGVGTVALGLTERLTGGDTLLGKAGPGFANLGQGQIGWVPYLFLYVLAIGAILYYVIEHTPLGRRLLVIGSNAEAGRLAGLRVNRIRAGTLVVSSLLAGVAGIAMAAKTGLANDTVGPAFLLPAFAALFLGSTQVMKRVNVAGALIAIFMLGTGVKGLQLLGADPWVNSFFNGAVLLIAVAFARRTQSATEGHL